MRPTAITLTSVCLLLSPISALQIPSIFAPFNEPYIEDALLASNQSSAALQYELLKRQSSGSGGCPLNFNACTKDGYRGACCTAGSACTTDTDRNVACCPNGMKCTGVVTAGAPASIPGGTAVFGSPATTTANSPTTTTATGPVSVITNPYFPFPIIATTYPNSAACNTAYEACQTNYKACTANLQGGGFGVTIVAPQGGGVTVAPTAQNLAPASATSICSSLSQQACYGIVSANCAQFGQGSGGSFVVGTTGNWAARPTVGCLAAAAGVMAGVGMGFAGQIL